MTELDMNRSGTAAPGKEMYHGPAYGGGIEYRMGQSGKYYINIQALRYHNEDDFLIDGASLGLRYRY